MQSLARKYLNTVEEKTLQPKARSWSSRGKIAPFDIVSSSSKGKNEKGGNQDGVYFDLVDYVAPIVDLPFDDKCPYTLTKIQEIMTVPDNSPVTAFFWNPNNNELYYGNTFGDIFAFNLDQKKVREMHKNSDNRMRHYDIEIDMLWVSTKGSLWFFQGNNLVIKSYKSIEDDYRDYSRPSLREQTFT